MRSCSLAWKTSADCASVNCGSYDLFGASGRSMILMPASLAAENACIASSSVILESSCLAAFLPTVVYYCINVDSDSSVEISTAIFAPELVKLLRSSVLLSC